MRKEYTAPSAQALALDAERFLSMSYGGDGDGREAQTSRFEEDFDWDAEYEE